MIFIDTAYLFALSMRTDGLHEAAKAWCSRLPGPFAISEYVLMEYANGLSSPASRGAVAEVIEGYFESDSSTMVVPSSTELFREGLELYKHRRDKSWSLTDCTSFVIMERHKIKDALTHDHHFEQAGYKALLRYAPPRE